MKSVSVACLAIAAAFAGPLPAASETPTAAQVVQRHIDAIGGAASLKRFDTRTSRGTVKVQGLSGTIETHSKRPDRSYQKIDLKVIVQESGCDGKAAWRRDQNGLRELTGAELDQAREAATMDRILSFQDPEVFASFTLLGTEEVGGRPAYKIEFVSATGGTYTAYYDTETYLETRRDSSSALGQTTIKREVYFEDYRKVEGLTVPFRTRQVTPFNETVIEIEAYELGRPIDDAVFAVPAAS